MARVHSPGYPNMSLPKAIAAAKKIFDADRTSPIDRVVAAKHMGYAGQSGASDKALASLAHYGLTEKTGKGEIKLSTLTLDIIHPDPSYPDTKAKALLKAGMKPQIFSDLYERFGDHVSEDALRSFLIRSNFQNIAINPVINSYVETCRFLEQEKAFESGGEGGDDGPESGSDDITEPTMDASTLTAEPSSAAHAAMRLMPLAGTGELNKINMNIVGDEVTLAATLDYRGLVMLEKKIARLKALMEPDDELEAMFGSDSDEE